MVEEADAARLDGPFFVITKRHHPSGRNATVLTLRSQDVVGAEIMKDGIVADYVWAATNLRGDCPGDRAAKRSRSARVRLSPLAISRESQEESSASE
jgi:hypothetical protein